MSQFASGRDWGRESGSESGRDWGRESGRPDSAKVFEIVNLSC